MIVESLTWVNYGYGCRVCDGVIKDMIVGILPWGVCHRLIKEMGVGSLFWSK